MSATLNAPRAIAHRDALPPVLLALRAATASRHTQLDSGMPLAVDAPTLHDYATHLQVLLAWLAPIEAGLAKHTDGPQSPAWQWPGRHTDRLRADLDQAKALGTEGAVPIAPEPPCPTLISKVGSGDAHAAYRWGVCYVIEGSQLGGLVLYRRLADRLTPHPLNYLNPHEDPAAIGRRWQQFIRTIGSAVTRDDDVAQACQGACDAFDDILAWRDRLPAATPAEISR